MHHLVQVGYGRPERTEKNKKLFKSLDFFDNLVLDEISKRMGVDSKKFFKIYKDDKWWSAKDALKANIIDEIKSFSLVKREIKYKFVPFWRRF
jgi:ClpP class serine protease